MEEFERYFQTLQRDQYFPRLGKVFKTDKYFYFLDMGTGKIAQVDKDVYLVLKLLFETNNDFKKLTTICLTNRKLKKTLAKICLAVEEQHVLSAAPFEEIQGKAMYLESMLENEISSIILEVTERCNLRCNYCIYHSKHQSYREFGNKNMSIALAKKAIDFLASYSKCNKEIYIGFYGGEPLINFPLIKQSIKYAKNLFNDQKITFSMTTNATLLTEEIADFLVANEMSIIISLDGPKDIHNQNRVFINQEGSFTSTLKGVENLIKAYCKQKIEPNFGFNMVITNAYNQKIYDEIYDLFNSIKNLPENFAVTLGGVNHDPHDYEYILPQSLAEIELLKSIDTPMFLWHDKKQKKLRNDEPLYTKGAYNQGLLRVHKRIMSDYPLQVYGMQGCCAPGVRRLYVTTEGNFNICEKVGNIPSLGNIDDGFDLENIKKYYFDDYLSEVKKYCQNCWAVNLCGLCYTNCYDSNGMHFKYRHLACMEERALLEESLIRYHKIFEENPYALEYLNEIEIT
jgi:uncharacterized protein